VFSDVLLLPQPYSGSFVDFLLLPQPFSFSSHSAWSRISKYQPLFENSCVSIRGCSYNCRSVSNACPFPNNPAVGTNECYRLPITNNNLTFLIMVICVLVLFCINECCKMTFIAVSLWRKRLAAPDYLASSILCPLVSFAGIDSFGMITGERERVCV
jgi:hypothetical protein